MLYLPNCCCTVPCHSRFKAIWKWWLTVLPCYTLLLQRSLALNALCSFWVCFCNHSSKCCSCAMVHLHFGQELSAIFAEVSVNVPHLFSKWLGKVMQFMPSFTWGITYAHPINYNRVQYSYLGTCSLLMPATISVLGYCLQFYTWSLKMASSVILGWTRLHSWFSLSASRSAM